MNRFAFFMLISLAVTLAASSCRQEPKEKEPEVPFKRVSNSVIIRTDGDPDRLVPILSISNYANQVMANIFLPLLSLDPSTMSYVPVLAKARPEIREITEGPYQGGLAYTFEIHSEAVWDDGKPVTANDYIFTLKALLNPKVQSAPYRPYVAIIKDVQVEAGNPKRFTVFTNEKSFQGEEYVSNTFLVMPEHLYDPQGLMREVKLTELCDPEKAASLAESNPKLQQFADAFSDQKYGRDPQFVNGCGPYRLEQWETGQQLVLRKKENWWGDPLAGQFPMLRAMPDELIFKPIVDATTTVAALKAEEVDVAYNIDPDGFEELKNESFVTDRYAFEAPATMAFYLIYVNTRNPKLADKRVRQAIAHAIDVEEMVNNVFNGYGELVAGPILPSFSSYNKNLKPYDFNIERAAQLLAEAGWKDSNNNGIVDKEINGKRTELELGLLITAGRETSQTIALLIQDNARRAGILINAVPQEPASLLDNIRKREYELASAGRNFNSPSWNPIQNFHTQLGDNRSGFGNAELDAKMEKATLTLDEKERNKIMGELQATIHEEVPEIPLFTLTTRLAIHKRFQGEVFSLFPGFVPAWLKLKDQYREN